MDVSALYNLYLECGMQVSTDTRQIGQGVMFFALKGAHFNGNHFAEGALAQGAAYAVVDEGDFNDVRIIKVDNVLKTLQGLAALHRKTLNPRVLAIAGSNGKTTTKELVVSVLSTEYSVLSTQGNFNNHIGLPLTLLQLRDEHQIAVLEMGANKAGDINELCDIAAPELGLLTNIGKEHLEGFGSIEGVAAAEGELFEYLFKTEGHAFVNCDDPWLKTMGEHLTAKTEFGKAHSKLQDVRLTPQIQFSYQNQKISSPLMGEHNLQNIMAAIAIGEFFHISATKIEVGISRYSPQNNRSQWVETARGNKVLLDAYNANPSSVEAALRTFDSIPGDKVLVLGDMFELGAFEASEHQHIADICATAPAKHVFLVGKAFAACENTAGHVHLYAEKADAVLAMRELAFQGVTVLIKGSRGMKMEDFLELF